MTYNVQDFSKRNRYNLGLLRKKTIHERDEFLMKTGKNRVIESKKTLTTEEKEAIKKRYFDYYQHIRSKRIKAMLLSILLTSIVLYGLVLLVRSAGL